MDTTFRQLAAVWFADIAGYTRLSRHDETAALGLIDLFQQVARTTTERHNGTLVKFLGDGVLAYTYSASSAIGAVLALRDEFQHRSSSEILPSFLRIGLHIGDLVIRPEGDVFGDAVNVASRLQAAAGPGQIYVSEDIWRQCRQRSELDFMSLGPRQIKGLDEPMRIHELSPPEQLPEMLGAGHRDSQNNTSLAILPFELLGTNQDAVFLASGIHNDLLTQLSRITGMTVISRTSVMGYQGTTKPIPVIARELNVTTVVEGAVQSAGNRVRVTVQLIDGQTDVHRWAEHFDRELSTEALFDIQTELTERVVESLQAELSPTGPDEATGPATASMEAYRLVAEGRMQFDRKTEEGLERAIDLFERAVKLDPEYGLAWCGLADSLAIMADYGYGDREALIASARTAAGRARELLPQSGASHASLGVIAEVLQDAPTALREHQRTIELDPSHADAHSWHAWVSLIVGEGPQALVSATRAVELNPLSSEAVCNLALSHLAVGEPEHAVVEARRAVELSEDFTTAAYYLGLAVYDLGQFEEAISVLTPLSFLIAGELTTPWASMCPDAALALAQIAAGQAEEAVRTFGSIDPDVYPFEVGIVHAGLGDVERAFFHFSRVESAPYGPALMFHHHFRDIWARLRDDPRLVELGGVVKGSWRVEPLATG